MISTLRTALLTLAALTAAVASQASAQTDKSQVGQEASFGEALELLKSGRHAAAYGRLMRLADAGHAQSARWALMMHAHGSSVYRSEWYASPTQQATWNALVINQMRHYYPVASIGYGE